MKGKIFWIVVIIVSLFTINVYCKDGQWFDNRTVYSIVLIEKEVVDTLGNRQIVPQGTGFIMRNYKNETHPIIVTCAHIIKNLSLIYVVITADSSLIEEMEKTKASYLALNKDLWELEDNNLRLRVNLEKNKTYVSNDSLDIMAFPITMIQKIAGDSTSGDFKLMKFLVIPQSLIKTNRKSNLGDEIYFVGFPFGIGTKYSKTGYAAKYFLSPLLRSGSIAWISTDNKIFLLDAFSYSGNSGSPVFTKKSWGKPGPYIIGMINGHLGMENENFGLARCVGIDDILNIVKLAENL